MKTIDEALASLPNSNLTPEEVARHHARNRTEEEIKKERRYVYKDGPFDEGIAYLKAHKIKLANPWDLFEGRTLHGTNDKISIGDTYVAISLIYTPKKKDVLVVDRRHDPILRNPKKATDAHRGSEKFYVDDTKFRKLAETDPEKAIESGVLLLSRGEIERLKGEGILTNKFGEDKYGYFLARQQSRPYGSFLIENGIESVTVTFDDQEYVNNQKKPYAVKLLVRGLGDWSELDGDVHYLNDLDDPCGRVFGVQVLPAKHVEKNLEHRL